MNAYINFTELHLNAQVEKLYPVNPTTTFIANHNSSFLTCLFAYRLDVPGYVLRVVNREQSFFITRTLKRATRNTQQYRMTQKETIAK